MSDACTIFDTINGNYCMFVTVPPIMEFTSNSYVNLYYQVLQVILPAIIAYKLYLKSKLQK